MERGVSLNSARSILDHIFKEMICMLAATTLTVSSMLPYLLLSYIQTPLRILISSLKDFVEHLAVSVDIVFPFIHGHFGEDGTLQCMAELGKVVLFNLYWRRRRSDTRLCGRLGPVGRYIKALDDHLLRILPNSFSKAHGIIEMPTTPPELLIFEPFIETAEIKVSSKSHCFTWEGRSRWIVINVGVIGARGSMHSLSPSVTGKESGDILSLEEKLQGGTGINITPPPASIIRP